MTVEKTEDEKITGLRDSWLEVAKAALESRGGFPIAFMVLGTRHPMTGEVLVDGPMPMVLTDPEERGANDPAHKNALSKTVKALALASGALASLFISDTWVVTATKEEEEANPHVPDGLHKDPRRREAISLIIEKGWSREVVFLKQFYRREGGKIIYEELSEETTPLDNQNGRMAVLPRTDPTPEEIVAARLTLAATMVPA